MKDEHYSDWLAQNIRELKDDFLEIGEIEEKWLKFCRSEYNDYCAEVNN
jgi:hypothetical protein